MNIALFYNSEETKRYSESKLYNLVYIPINLDGQKEVDIHDIIRLCNENNCQAFINTVTEIAKVTYEPNFVDRLLDGVDIKDPNICCVFSDFTHNGIHILNTTAGAVPDKPLVLIKIEQLARAASIQQMLQHYISIHKAELLVHVNYKGKEKLQ